MKSTASVSRAKRNCATKITSHASVCCTKYQVSSAAYAFVSLLASSGHSLADWSGCAHEQFNAITEGCTCDFEKFVYYCKETCYTNMCNNITNNFVNWVNREHYCTFTTKLIQGLPCETDPGQGHENHCSKADFDFTKYTIKFPGTSSFTNINMNKVVTILDNENEHFNNKCGTFNFRLECVSHILVSMRPCSMQFNN